MEGNLVNIVILLYICFYKRCIIILISDTLIKLSLVVTHIALTFSFRNFSLHFLHLFMHKVICL